MTDTEAIQIREQINAIRGDKLPSLISKPRMLRSPEFVNIQFASKGDLQK